MIVGIELMSAKARSGHPRIVDRVLSFLGSPSATNHEPALRAADKAVKASADMQSQAQQLVEVMRQLDATLGR